MDVGFKMAESSGYMESQVSSDIAPSSDEEEFGSTASVTSQGLLVGMGKDREEESEQFSMATDQLIINNSVEVVSSESSGQNDTNHTDTFIPGTMNDLQGNGDGDGDPSTPQSGKRPSHLFDLPVEILKEIVKEVTHTNDLTALALTCSTSHAMTIPHMYSRFDIVWPDSQYTSDHPGGVDALSYGLATLVMGDDIFHGIPPSDATPTPCSHCGCDGQHSNAKAPGTDTKKQARRGNYFAQYTRKFSIGNGPSMWVKEYYVTKETGKMLGTLVALAVARMVNLETFIWDMPTGVLRDVWIALGSLADRPGHECRLERVWVRWHNNSENSAARTTSGYHASSSLALPTTLSSPNLPLGPQSLLQKYRHVEYPTLSVLPPLKSLSVLDIDEPSYLEEMAVLIERSRDRLTELRIGMSSKVCRAYWFQPIRGRSFQPNTSTNWPKAGGVLEVLCYNSSSNLATDELDETAEEGSHSPDGQASQQMNRSSISTEAIVASSVQQESATAESLNTPSPQHEAEAVGTPEPDDTLLQPAGQSSIGVQGSKDASPESSKSLKAPSASASKSTVNSGHTTLKLEILELEQIVLSVSAMMRAFDWSKLTTLTILGCEGHEKLWRALRRQYAPSNTERSGLKNTCNEEGDTRNTSAFPLRLKNIHTDAVSSHLLLFIKDSLAPNTLESVFLHEVIPHYYSVVNIDAIYRNVLRKHRMSLKRVLIDVIDRAPITSSSRWRRWMFNREMILFVTSGKMPRLRELSMAIDNKDWHLFIQRLPGIPYLRAIHISNHNYPPPQNPKELALQILDVVTIRPEVSLAYIGMQSKCYEILEGKEGDKDGDSDNINGTPVPEPWEESDEEEEEDEDGDEDVLSEEEDTMDGIGSDNDMSSSENPSSDEDETGSDSDKSQVVFKLREILFYDDKIGIFKARHGVL